ncbi:sodium-dependent transporter [Mergibacter septicus]|uniref:sodium-dependent transporter n=1 Tax=Mergibacter septicus TaxID=221402 RepID=UPI001178F532|nr:sodium-dependent transporter [Mergibacter septicus]AWX13962.1 sodium-dependent transporter [Mergibacter septicus]
MSRSQWGSRIGFILASAGSAIGLGAIWKFPYVTATQGGGAFLFIYLVISLTIGLILMSTEMALGRTAHAGPIGAFRRLGGKAWASIGIMSVVVAFLILSFYSVVGGWTVAYLVKSITGSLVTSTDSTLNQAQFTNFITDDYSPIFYHFIFAFLTLFTVMSGVEKGIERMAKYLMPLLLLLILVLIARVITLPGAEEGIRFFLTPDFSKVTSNTWLEALGLAFFSLSLGLGAMITYGSYVGPETKLLNSSAWVIILTLITCILAGLMVLPAMSAFGFKAEAGPGLTFITMPAVFASMPFSALFSSLFFALLLVAALTSSISLLEVLVSFFIDEFKMRRVKAGILSFILFFLVGAVASLSLGSWSEYTIFGYNFFDALDKLTQNILMPLGEICLAIFVAWFSWKPIKISLAGHNNHSLGFKLFYFGLAVIVPIIIFTIFWSGLFN